MHESKSESNQIGLGERKNKKLEQILQSISLGAALRNVSGSDVLATRTLDQLQQLTRLTLLKLIGKHREDSRDDVCMWEEYECARANRRVQYLQLRLGSLRKSSEFSFVVR